MEELLGKLVAMPTITDDITANDKALDYLEKYFVGHGLHAKRFRFDGHSAFVATTRKHRKTPLVMLAAHVDVMPGGEDLFSMDTKGDRLLGRGTYDMKFAIAAYMQLVAELAGKVDDYDFGVMITSDEEFGGRDGINAVPHLLEAGYIPQVSILPDGGTDYQIESLAKGHWRFELVATGLTAHGSRPWEGESASFKLIEALRDLKKHFKRHGPLTNTLNIGYIHGGVAYNQVPDRLAAAVEIRLMDLGTVPRLQKIVDTIAKKYGVTYQTHSFHEPVATDLNDPLIKAFLQSVTRVTGKLAGSCISYAASDGYYFALRGIPCILTRPEGGGHHGHEEWISRKSLAQLVPILKDYLEHTARTQTAAPVDKQSTLSVK